ncbi:hypothetical protein [Enterobacter sp.]|uniref:hypothetical protein n=1 Tax=Enterobacter sp. TaxID=42895 RepID=UPI00296E5204|nr:hypothetical protein [Enterobacter sp.]
MTERGMIFNSEMVRALLNGTKTQTRRIIKLSHERGMQNPVVRGKNGEISFIGCRLAAMLCPFGQPGDHIWVRETWADVNLEGIPAVAYRADDDVYSLMDDKSFLDEDGAFNYEDPRVAKYSFAAWYSDLISGTEGRWTPSIYMPRWASRITLEITDVRVEQLKHVPRDEIIAEGYPAERAADGGDYDPFLWYRDLWESIYGEGSWQANPWVWVIDFRRIAGGAA